METSSYADWARYHGLMFGMDRERDAETFAVWIDVFESLGYSPQELTEATKAIASNPDAPTWRDGHLEALKRRVSAARRDADRAKVERFNPGDGDRGVCVDCGGSGYVSVPLLRCLVNGEWIPPFATGVVACNCRLGQFMIEANTKRRIEDQYFPLLIRLCDYSIKVPNWRDFLKWRAEMLKRDSIAMNQSRHADKTFGELKRKFGIVTLEDSLKQIPEAHGVAT